MSTSRYINKVRSLVQAKSTKVQYKNHSVGTDIIFNGIIPCKSILKRQIIYSLKQKCDCINLQLCDHNISQNTNLNGGTSSQVSNIILNGGNPSQVSECIINGNGTTICDHNLSQNTNLNGGTPSQLSNTILNGGSPSQVSQCVLNTI
jgi:hypothetical protein